MNAITDWIMVIVEILFILATHKLFKAHKVSERCEQCQDDMPWEWESTPGMTSYCWDGIGEDPNRDVRLCPECSSCHVSHWEEMWAEYHGGLL